MSISQSERRSDPQSILLRGQKREVFALSATYPLIEVPLKIIRFYLTSFTGKKSSQSQGKGHCQLLPKDWKTASHALTGDPLAPQQPPVAMGRHYAYAPLYKACLNKLNFSTEGVGGIGLAFDSLPKKYGKNDILEF